MEDRKTALAVLLSIGFIMIYSQVVMEPYLKKAQPATHTQTSQAQSSIQQPQAISQPNQITTPPSTTQSQQITTTSNSELSKSATVIVDTDLFHAVLTPVGARLLELKLKRFQKELGSKENVDLVASSDAAPLPLGLYVGNLNDRDVHYQLNGNQIKTGLEFKVTGNENAKLTFTGKLSDGSSITKVITFSGNSYVATLDGQIAGNSAQATSFVEWTHFAHAGEATSRLDPYGFRVLGTDNKITTNIGTNIPVGDSALIAAHWVSLHDKYFLVSLVPGAQGAPVQTSLLKYTDGAELLASKAAVGQGILKGSLFLGPKDTKTLEQSGFELQRNIDLGVFAFLAFPLLWLLRFLEAIIGNWGLAIIALTLLIKAVFLPLTKASFTSMRAMQDLQPEIKALRERISDPTQLNQEMLALYKRRGVNPMGGCFPILIQIPVFIGLYNVLLNAIELRHSRFGLWIHDLSAPEALILSGIHIPVCVIILGVSMFIQQYMTPNTMDPAQRKAMYLMPIILTLSFIIYPLPAGLTLYWLVNNSISIVQQAYIKNDRKASPLTATAVAGVGLFAFGFVLTLI